MERLFEVGVSNALMATFLAIIAALVALVCRRPALMHALWLLVLLKLVTPPLVPISVIRQTRPAAVPEAAIEQPEESLPDAEPGGGPEPEREEMVGLPVAEAEPALEEDKAPEDEPTEESKVLPTDETTPGQTNWLYGLVGLWVVGSFLWFSLAIRRVWCFARALRYARPASSELKTRVSVLAWRIGLSRCPEVLVIPGRVAPLVWGLGRPRLLVPEGLLGLLGGEGLDTLLLHELAHIRRRDHLVRWLEFLALGLFWWNPIAWYARRELRESEEQCCDAWVVSTLPGTSRTYATALLDALDFLCNAQPDLPPLASGLGQVADLKRRLTMILSGATPHGLGRSSGLVVACLAVLLLPVVPGIGQTQEPEKRETKVIRHDGAEKIDLDLKKLQVEIEKKSAELAVLKATMDRLQVQAMMRARQRDLELKVEAARLDATPRIKEAFKIGPVVHIEISGLNMTPEELVKLAEVLEKLPGKEKRVLIRARPADAVRVWDAKTGKQIQVQVGGPVRFAPVAAKPILPPGAPPTNVRATEKRLDNLEHALQSIMRELEALRKDLRGGKPGGGGGSGGAGGAVKPMR